MPTRRTLICAYCGKEWHKTSQKCEIDVDKKHYFVVLKLPCIHQTEFNTLVCECCGQEWSTAKGDCVSDSNRHYFIGVDINDEQYDRYCKRN